MRESLTQSSIRQGFIVALDGLAIWLIAVLLASNIPMMPAKGLHLVAVDIMSDWLRSPTMSALETVAYTGLAIALVGPAWYWVVRPLKKSVDQSPAGELPTETDSEFRFDHDISVDSPRDSVTADPLTSEYERLVPEQGQRGKRDWVSSVFGNEAPQRRLLATHEIPEGDFFRSPSGSSNPDEEAGSETGLQDSKILVSYTQDDAGEEPIVGETGSTDYKGESAVSNGVHGEEIVDMDHDSAETNPQTDEENPDADRPADPFEAIADAVDHSRGKLDTVSNRLSEPGNGSTVDSAAAAVSDVIADTGKSFESLPERLPDTEGSVQDFVEEAREDQSRIQSAFGTIDGD